MGKSGSKLKKKRSQSIAWSFRFPSLSSLSRRKMPLSPRPHLDVRQWLNVLDLGQYASIFEKFDGVEDLLGFSEADIKDLGVKNSAHRARVVSSLVALRLKHERGNRKVEKPQRHSVAVDTGRLVNQNGNSDILVVSDAIQSKSLCNLVMEATPDPSADPAQLKKALEWELSLDARDLRSHAWYHGAIPRTRAEEIVEQNDGDFLVRDCTSQPGNYVLTVRWKGQSLHFVINKVVIQPDTVYERVQYQFEDDAYDTVPDLITYYVGSGKSISSASGARIISPRNRLYPLSFYASKYGLQQQQRGAVSPLASPLQGSGPAGTLRYNPYNSYKSPVHSPPRSKRETPPRLPSKKQRSQSLTPAEQLNGRPPSSGQVLSPRGDEKSNSADGVIQTAMSRSAYNSHENSNGSKFSSHSLPRPCGGKQPLSQQAPGSTSTLPNNKMVRVTSDPALSPCMERRRFGLYVEQEGDTDTGDTPPPKPSRVPSMMRSCSKDSSAAPPLPEKTGGSSSGEGMGSDANTSSSTAQGHHHQGTFQRVASYHASGSDSGNGSGDSAQSSAAGDATDPIATPVIQPTHRGVVIKNPRYHSRQLSGGGGMATSCSSSTLKPLEYDSAAEDSLLMLSIPDPEPPSAFDLENFQTLLLPTLENKPLDATALQGVKIMLQDNGPRILANHLTKVDLELIIGSSTGENSDLGLGIGSGIELITLPHGHQLRLDLVERTECLKLLVAVTILTCATEVDRAEALNKWIQVAIDTKTALGNLFGFCGVMMGLCMPQVQRLSSTWHVLRQKFTDSAFNFEAKLRPTLKSMNECTNPQAPNTTIPHLLPFILLQERTLDDILGTNASGSHSMTSSCLAPWESTADFGLGTLFAHMEAARKFGESLPMFRRNAEIVLGDAKIDELLMDAFRTEFHLKFLWGSRGACVAAEERHAKFQQVLTVMSDKCESPQPSTPASPPAAIGTSV